MRLAALLLAAPLLLAGCLVPPAAQGAPDAADEGAAPRGGPTEPGSEPARADAASLLPLALRWARAWQDDAELVGFTSALGEDGTPDLGRVAQPLDGQDALWGFRFSSPATRGVLVVQLRADGTAHDVFATGSAEPTEPSAALGIGTREARWLALARTAKVVDAFEAHAATKAWAGADVDAVSYEMALRDGGEPRLTVTAWKGDRYLAALVDADAWKVLVGSEVPPRVDQLGSTFNDASSSIPLQ